MAVEDIKNQIFGNNDSISHDEALCVIMKEYGLSYNDLVGAEVTTKHEVRIFGLKIASATSVSKTEALSLPTFYMMINYLEKENKQKNKAAKKGGKK